MATLRTCRPKLAFATLAVLAVLSLVACGRGAAPDVTPIPTADPQAGEACVDAASGARMTYAEAVAIAEAGVCVEEGPLLETHMCNESTGTWWIDLDIEQPGCNPACVVSVTDETAEINWRCTGLLPQVETSVLPTPLPPTSTPDPTENWAKYSSLEDGIVFLYPPQWSIELLIDQEAMEGGDEPARAVLLTQDTLELRIAFKQRDEGTVIGPGALADGTVEQRGTVSLLGRDIPRLVVVDEGADRAVFAGDRFGDLELYIELTDNPFDNTSEPRLPETALAEFDAIVTTFRRTDPEASDDAYPGWAAYRSAEIAPGLGLLFRHRSDWTLTETPVGTETATGPAAAMVTLQRDPYYIRVQYKAAGAQTVLAAPDVDDSLLREAGTAWFMGRPAPRIVVVDEEDRLTRIFVTYDGDDVIVSVELAQNESLVEDDEVALSMGIRNELDEILASFRVVTP